MGGYAWQDGEILAGADRGHNPAQLPEQTASLWNRYDFNRQWGAGLGAIYRSELYPNINNQVVVKGYTRYDAAVFFQVNELLGLQLNIENIFDKKYFVSANSNDNITPGSPRAAYLSVNLRF